MNLREVLVIGEGGPEEVGLESQERGKESRLKMSDNSQSEQVYNTEVESSTDLSNSWEQFFSALVNLLNECERLSVTTTDNATREAIGIRLEYSILALQQILPLLNQSRATFVDVLRNLYSLHDYYCCPQLSSCSQLAVYMLDVPEVLRSGNPGRPKYIITEEILVTLRSTGFTRKDITKLLNVSRWTLQRRVSEFGLKEVTGFTAISDNDLDHLVRAFMQTHGTLVGYSLVAGHLRSLGYRIQRDRVRTSIARVDPSNSYIRWATVISRRTYSVPGPNSLWHQDGHHSLVTWGFVVHGAIDGYSRLIVFLSCSTNNRSDTVKDKFLQATERYEWPSRVRTDMGGENVGVWELMEAVHGENRGSYLAGSSTQNQRIEHLWRDVFQVVTHMYYYTFQCMEEAGMLDRNNAIHMFVLHYIYLPRINEALQSFVLPGTNILSALSITGPQSKYGLMG